MHELVKYVMRGPKQAILLASISVMLPMMFWFGAATIALITLRQGLSQGLVVFIWTIIPALGWWFGLQDPGALIVLISTFAMAAVLRYTVSWQSTLVTGGVISLVTGLLAPYIMPEMIDMLVEMGKVMLQDLAKSAPEEYNTILDNAFRTLMIASFAASFYGMAVGSVFLARSWQARLFNPGGWQEEFHQMRLSPRFVLGVVGAVIFASAINIEPVLVLMIATVPFIVCGLALVHGVVGKRKLGGQWIFGLYASVFILFPTVLILLVVLALLDSLVNFRSRVQAQQ
ncbi:MAG: hypothetical protein ACI84K_000883 [Pseudohongiellaceae bacterium]|jgi:hypothetical protein